jgi:acylphosphatase
MKMVYNTYVKKSVVNVRIRGFVQGVFFRASTKETADSLGLKGWVRNMPDGSVEALFEGETVEVKRAVKWCCAGPTGATVKNVDEKWGDYLGEYDSFEIRYGY